MSQVTRIGRHKTHLYQEGGDTIVKYWSTEVVRWNRETITLKCGNHFTATTKLRMNQTSNQFNLGYRVFQKDYDWFVKYDGEVIPFSDGMALERSNKNARHNKNY